MVTCMDFNKVIMASKVSKLIRVVNVWKLNWNVIGSFETYS